MSVWISSYQQIHVNRFFFRNRTNAMKKLYYQSDLSNKHKWKMQVIVTYLRWVRKLPLTCPEPSHPGVGHDIPSVFTDFQENCEPFRYPSFCLLAARGHPDALRWDAYFPVIWPWPSQPGTGHLYSRQTR